MDVPSLVIVVLLALFLLVIGELLRAFIDGRVLAPPWHRRPLQLNLLVFCAALFVWMAIPVTIALALRLKETALLERLEAQTIANLLTVAIVLILMRAAGTNRLADYGIEMRGWRDEVRYGTLGFLASLPLVIIVLQIMEPQRTPEDQHAFLKLLLASNSSRTILEVMFGAIIAAPLAEELIFRVVLQGTLELISWPAVAVLLPAAAFAAIHGKDAVPLLPLAVVLGIVYHLRRSYVAVVTLHALFNAFMLCLALALRHLSASPSWLP